jgi:hypothetical protein
MIKYVKSEVGFEHPARGDHHCGECTHFLRHRELCEIVVGHIEAEDWCRKFDPK